MLEKLEEELDASLFDRFANRIEVNACGKVALVHARSALQMVSRLREDVQAEAGRSSRLTVCFCDPGPQWYAMPRFLVDHPEVQVTELIVDAPDPVPLLRERVCDVYVAPAAVQATGIQSVPFLFDQCYLSVPWDNALGNRQSVSFADISAQPLLYPLIGGYFMRVRGCY